MARTRKAKFTRTQGMQVEVSSAPTEDIDQEGLEYVDLSVTVKDPNFQGGQSADIDVTVIASTSMESTAGLPDNGTFTMNSNWKRSDPAQKVMVAANADGKERAFRVTFSDGSKARFLAYVSQYNWQAAGNGVVAGSFNTRVTGDVVYEDGPVAP